MTGGTSGHQSSAIAPLSTTELRWTFVARMPLSPPCPGVVGPPHGPVAPTAGLGSRTQAHHSGHWPTSSFFLLLLPLSFLGLGVRVSKDRKTCRIFAYPQYHRLPSLKP